MSAGEAVIFDDKQQERDVRYRINFNTPGFASITLLSQTRFTAELRVNGAGNRLSVIFVRTNPAGQCWLTPLEI